MHRRGNAAVVTDAVETLMQRLGVSASGTSREAYVESLLAGAARPSSKETTRAQVARTNLMKSTPDPKRFAEVHRRLQEEGVPNLDRFLCVLDRAVKDPTLLDMLAMGGATHTGASTASASSTTTDRTPSKRSKTSTYTSASSSSSSRSAGQDFMSPSSRKLLEDISVAPSTSSGRPSHSKQEVSATKEAQALSGHRNTAKFSENIPQVPQWVDTRPYLGTGFLLEGSTNSTGGRIKSPLSSMPVEVQELIILDELLSAMLGFETRHIQLTMTSPGVAAFHVDSSVDGSLMDIVERILPMCQNFIRLEEFLEERGRYEWGMVNHAFCACVQKMLKEYSILVVQLETEFKKQNLTLQKLWFHLQPAMKTMEVLERVCREASRTQAAGGQLLECIQTLSAVMGGDRHNRNLFEVLLAASCQPFFDMLEHWIYQGTVEDPYHEFMIEERKEFTKETLSEDFENAYWKKRYSIRREQFPSFLKRVMDKILTTGRYLNVIRECGHKVVCPDAQKLKYTFHEREYVEAIEHACSFSSQALLSLLVEDHQLLERLRSIKRFFFLENGDFFVHFMDQAEDLLKRKSTDISVRKLENLLDLSLRMTSADSDPYKDNVSCTILSFSLVDQILGYATGHDSRTEERTANNLPGIETFSLTYQVDWPLSLIFNKASMNLYQILFRQLFFFKHVERRLCACWASHQQLKGLNLNDIFVVPFTLRRRMLHLVQNLVYYMTVEVLEPSWHVMESRIRKSHNVDELMSRHYDSLLSSAKGCMLFMPKLMKVLMKVLTLCVRFAEHTEQFASSINMEASEVDRLHREALREVTASGKTLSASQKLTLRTQVVENAIREIAEEERYLRTVQSLFQHTFDQQMTELMHNLVAETSAEPNLANLIARL